MNFKRVLHPEIVLDLRGDESQRQAYRLCRDLKQVQEKGAKNIIWSGPSMLLRADEFGKQHFFGMRKYLNEPRKLYHFNKDFLEVLGRVDRNLSVDLFPDKFFAYFSFPKDSVKDEEGFIQGCYVYSGTPKDFGINMAGVNMDELTSSPA